VNIQYVWRASADRARIDLAERIVSSTLKESGRLTGVFDDSDYENSRMPRYWPHMAWHMNVATGGVESRSPEHMLEIMERPDCEHVIWLAERAALGDETVFVWVFAHELQHMNQCCAHPELSFSMELVRAVLKKKMGEIFAYEIPAELDAEYIAYGELSRLLGEGAFEKKVESESAEYELAEPYYTGLVAQFESYRGDWAERTRALICESRQLLSATELAKLGDGVDFDTIC